MPFFLFQKAERQSSMNTGPIGDQSPFCPICFSIHQEMTDVSQNSLTVHHGRTRETCEIVRIGVKGPIDCKHGDHDLRQGAGDDTRLTMECPGFDRPMKIHRSRARD